MKSKRANILLLLIFSFGINSCATEIFRLNQRELHKSIPGYYLSGFASVDIINDNSLMLKKDAAISLKNIESTEWEASFDLLTGENMNLDLQFRTTRHELEEISGIVIKLRDSYIEFYENGTEIGSRIDYKFMKNEKYAIKVLNDGARVKVLVDCDEVLDYRTKLLSTEYLIFKSISEEIFISSLEFTDVYKVEGINIF